MPDQIQVHSAFTNWLQEAQPNLKYRILIGHFEDNGFGFTFETVTMSLQGWVSAQNISISVFYDNLWWDTLFDLDVVPEKFGSGYVCGLCPDIDGTKFIFQDIEELWRDHLFKPLQTWINEQLAASIGIALYRTRSGASTRAKLCKSDGAKNDADAWLAIIPMA